MNYSELLGDLRTEADLCRNETADDIAQLLDAAADAIEASQSALRQLRSDVLSVMPANWREDPDWVALADAQKLTSNALAQGPGGSSPGPAGAMGSASFYYEERK